MRKRILSVLSNTDVAELLAQQAERDTEILSRAYRRAARSAFLWPEEVSDLIAQGRPLTELRGIGPFIEKQFEIGLTKGPIDRKQSLQFAGILCRWPQRDAC